MRFARPVAHSDLDPSGTPVLLALGVIKTDRFDNHNE